MGEASARAQSLKNPITSGSKMMAADGHTVYLLIDKTAAAGQGAVVGKSSRDGIVTGEVWTDCNLAACSADIAGKVGLS